MRLGFGETRWSLADMFWLLVAVGVMAGYIVNFREFWYHVAVEFAIVAACVWSRVEKRRGKENWLTRMTMLEWIVLMLLPPYFYALSLPAKVTHG